MPGSWEIKAARSVLVGFLHTEVTSVAWALSLRQLVVPGHIMPVAGKPYDHARNDICQAAVDGGYDWVFFIDSDVVPPRDVIPRLISRQKPVISGVYCRRSTPAGIPVALKGGQWLTDLPPSGLMEVDLVGAGCLLIHRSVLERFPEHEPGKRWFYWRGDRPQGEGRTSMSEDFEFCRRLKDTMGISPVLDLDVRCHHIGFAQFGLHSAAPLDYSIPA